MPRMPRWVWLVYIVLFAASVPWYLTTDDVVPIWIGLPYWVVLSLSAILCVALFTVWVVRRYWREDDL